MQLVECRFEDIDWVAWDRLAGDRSVFQTSAWYRKYATSAWRFCRLEDAGSVLAFHAHSLVASLPQTHRTLDPYQQLLHPSPAWRPALEGEYSPRNNPATPFTPRERDTSLDDASCCFPAVMSGETITHHTCPESRLLIEPTLSDAERLEVARSILGYLEAFARDSGARTVLLPYHTAEDASLLLRADPSLVAVYIYARHFIEVPDSFDRYLETLGGESRADARRNMRIYERAGCRTLELDGKEWSPQIRALIESQNTRTANLYDAEAILTEIAAPALPLAVLGGIANGELVGFSTFAKTASIWQNRHTGFGPLARKASAYFNLVYYDSVRLGVERKVPIIDYSYMMSRIKTDVGATASPRFFLIKAFDQKLDGLLRTYALPRARDALDNLDALLARYRRPSSDLAASIKVADSQR
jgi:hypothetical protein